MPVRRLQKLDLLSSSNPLEAELWAALSREDLPADLWHVACALYLAESPRELPFFTLDQRQVAVARRLGFPT